MKSFSYFSPTKVVFGSDALDHLAAELAVYSPKKILVLYGSGSVIKSGVLDKVTAALDAAKYDYIKIGGVQPNPLLSFAVDTIAKSQEAGVDFVLSVGGGSVIDTGKAVAIGLANPGEDIWPFWLREKTPTVALPHANVLTISAAGSETSQSAVLTNTENSCKRGLSSDLNRPKFAILNPEFTYTLPKYQVAAGVVDIFMHTMDRYFAISESNDMTDEIAEGLMRVVFKYGKTAVEDPTNYQAMSELMWAGSLSHVGLTGLGSPGDWTPHQMSHELSGYYDATHGAALACTWNAFANTTYEECPERFAQFARKVHGLEGDDVAIAKQAIDATVAYFKSLEMPVTISELIGRTLAEDELIELADACSFRKTRKVGTLKEIGYEGILAAYAYINK
ncbi:MAG: iron-containing alcohol dehydrogenase [Clostridia bacterium]